MPKLRLIKIKKTFLMTLHDPSKKSLGNFFSICSKQRAQKAGTILQLMLQLWACQNWKDHTSSVFFLALYVSNTEQNHVAGFNWRAHGWVYLLVYTCFI